MDIDERSLQSLWQRQQPPSELSQALVDRVERHRSRARLHRVAEAVLTIAGLTLLVWPGPDGRLSPSQWLLIPFFGVFLAVSWAIVLRGKRHRQSAAVAPVALYAQTRKTQLREGLRHLRLALTASGLLLAYAATALAVFTVMGLDAWRDAATGAVAWAVVWAAGTFLLTRSRGRTIRREYRRIRTLV